VQEKLSVKLLIGSVNTVSVSRKMYETDALYLMKRNTLGKIPCKETWFTVLSGIEDKRNVYNILMRKARRSERTGIPRRRCEDGR
jgi:hypothetical protein